MNIKEEFNKNILKQFCKLYNIKKKQLSNPHHYFRYSCFKYNYFIKHIPIPIFKKSSYYETVLIEFRIFPHLEFLIRNTILKLNNEKWSHTIICGTTNYDFIYTICQEISLNINIIKMDIDNLTQSEYSELLTTAFFWNLLKGEKILIYQEDSILFKNNIEDFLNYDYIGAPFNKSANDTPNSVGNGGLSLRSKSKMLKIINSIPVDTCVFNNSTLNYMEFAKMTFPPEDVYFSKCMQDFQIGNVADWNIAYNFSSEQIFNPNSFGGHKFWVSNKNVKDHLNKTFNYKKYKNNNNILDYLKYNNKPFHFNKNNKISNAFDVDLNIFCKIHNHSYINNNENNILQIVNNKIMNGFIYHPKQLINIFPDIKIYTFLNNMYIIQKKNTYLLKDFINNHLYNLNFDELSSLLIKHKYSNLDDTNNLLLLVFIGNEEIGITLINKIIQYKLIQSKFNIAFCFNSENIFSSENIKNSIKTNFKNYAIYICKEHGTDIIPTLLMYKDISKNYKFEHILKFHTKSIVIPFNELTDYLLSKPLYQLLKYKLKNCNCIGHPDYYKDLFKDAFNNKLKYLNRHFLDSHKNFVAGTIFYSSTIMFDTILEFIKNNNYRSYLLNNLYENNSINKDFSPIHFLERLFGIINLPL